MDIQSINDDIKTRQWIERIKECRQSGLPVRSRQNNICEQTYYCWLNIVITKGDVRIEFPCDTNIGTVTNIIGALLC